MKTRVFETSLWLPRPVDEVFGFFSDASNLELITPDWLHFEILAPGPLVMRPGLRIDYKLRLRGWSLRWQSEITSWNPPHRFVDEQRRGPYRLWAHEHTFSAASGGTLASDRVQYAVWGGWFADVLLVRRDLRTIFDYRQKKLTQLLAATPRG